MSETSENLGEAFAGESQANQRYLAFARKAQQEGYTQVAKLFRAAAAADHRRRSGPSGRKRYDGGVTAAVDR